MHSFNEHLLRASSVAGPKGQWDTQGAVAGDRDIPRLGPH